jgi:bifunctional N-acetylglucosamine-1-phosphate-uridyltransferase/glucosamine-1-phosphate-acetyltransferase GlmU-like protein
MKSRTPKILHEIGGRSLVGHALQAAPSGRRSWPSSSGMNAIS